MKRRILRLGFVLLCVLLSRTGTADPVRAEHIEVELISEIVSIRPGEPFWAALRLQPEEHWHIYWRNPGDTGLPPTIEWRLPAGSAAGEIQWPYPEQFSYRDVVDYGYEGETLLLTQIRPPEIWDGTRPFPVAASVSWLVCEDSCIPGSAELSLELPITRSEPTLNTRWAAEFAAARSRIPVTDAGWRASFTMHEEQLYLRVQTDTPVFARTEAVSFFPYDNEIIAYGAPQQTTWQPLQLDLRQAQNRFFETAPARLNGIIVIRTPSGESAHELSASPTLVAQPKLFDGGRQPLAAASPSSLLLIILSAIGGGILLNLMPCVFPVLSLKAISLLECLQISRREQRLHGVAYTLGAMTFFAIVAGVLLLLRASGESVGWGFQLQSPWFVALLAYLIFVMGLSFSGVLEIGAGFMSMGDTLANRGGLTGSFFTGALAAVVASPCTAPFMGTAVAYAISQPPAIALSVFVALGFGMALPFLVIAFVPALVGALPRPGPWMNVLRQFMAFPLYITAAWLLWVLGRQTDASGMALVLIGMILLAFASWVWKLRAHSKGAWRRWAAVLTVVATFSAFAILHLPFLSMPALQVDTTVTESDMAWEPYSAVRLAELRAERKPVFLNMTADWCITCIANEQMALSFPSVQRAFVDKQIARLKGDWTSRSPEITEVLRKFGREGVPLYVLYSPEPESEPVVLPQILTPSLLLSAFDNIYDGKQKIEQDEAVRIFDPMTGKIHTLGPRQEPTEPRD